MNEKIQELEDENPGLKEAASDGNDAASSGSQPAASEPQSGGGACGNYSDVGGYGSYSGGGCGNYSGGGGGYGGCDSSASAAALAWGPPTAQAMAHMQQLMRNQAQAQQEAPDLAITVMQQQALAYDLEKQNSMKMEPEVIEFAAHFDLSDRHAKALNEVLKHRNNTYDDDLGALYEVLGKCNNPAQKADLLNMNIRWMREGTFNGMYGPNLDVHAAATKYKLDAPAACKLSEALENRQDSEDDMRKICLHLERSNRPSSLVMMFLKELKAGNSIDDKNLRPIAIGSYLQKKESLKAQDRKRSRSRGRGGGRARSRSRRPRSRSRQRPRSRSRQRSRDRKDTKDSWKDSKDSWKGDDGGWNSRGYDQSKDDGWRSREW